MPENSLSFRVSVVYHAFNPFYGKKEDYSLSLKLAQQNISV